MIERDAEMEVAILRGKLDEAERKLARVEGALMETDMAIHGAMRRLLAANDVKGDRAMRINILEHMNDLRRNIAGFFITAGVSVENLKH
jgi:hypothetical protein